MRTPDALGAATERLCYHCQHWRKAGEQVKTAFIACPGGRVGERLSTVEESHCRANLQPLTSTGEDCPYFMMEDGE